MSADWYDYPHYFDLGFRDETPAEAAFLEAAFQKYAAGEVRRVLECGCGGGRLIVELARRGYQAIGFDLKPQAVTYVRRRLKRRRLPGEVFVADMRDFQCAPVDAVCNTFNTFRHLLTDDDARAHFRCVVDTLRPGGLFILGLHLLPPDADPECTERWTASHAGTRVTFTLKVLSCDRARRLEQMRINMLVRRGERQQRLRQEFSLRIYTADQVWTLLESFPELELCDVFDFWYDIDDPLDLDDEMGDTVLVLRKRDPAT